ncbi:MAG: hypothetical protein KOO63_12395 [Bacteroidales bacterium]|nr:hypothetical protein [Candidatus Latescibacterota bacterium]
MSLVESYPGHWQVNLKISSGTHRISISIDGEAWEAPPGLTPVNDEFGRTVSVLVMD